MHRTIYHSRGKAYRARAGLRCARGSLTPPSLCLPGTVLCVTTYLGEDRLYVPLAPTGRAPHHQIHVGAVAWLFRLAFALAPAP